MDHQEIFAIAHMLQIAKDQVPTDEFAQGFLHGVHYMEILHEIRVMETPDPPKHSRIVEAMKRRSVRLSGKEDPPKHTTPTDDL